MYLPFDILLASTATEICPYSPKCVELDFSHLRAKGVGYARHQSAQREVIELRTLPATMIRVLAPFAPLFSERVFRHAQVLLVGTFPQLQGGGP
jgi:hypothetical protein